MAVDAATLGLDKNGLLVRTENIAAEAIEADVAFRGCHVEEDIGLLAAAETAGDDLAAVRRNLGIALAVGQRFHTSHTAGSIDTTGEVFETEVFGLQRMQQCNNGQQQEGNSFHSSFFTFMHVFCHKSSVCFPNGQTFSPFDVRFPGKSVFRLPLQHLTS